VRVRPILALLASVWLSTNLVAASSNTDFSTAQPLETGISHRGNIDSIDLYFSINPQLETVFEFEVVDVEGQYLEFCLYHGPSESMLVDCFGYETKPTTLRISEVAVKDTYYLRISCGECELEGVGNVEYLISAEFTKQILASDGDYTLCLAFIAATCIVIFVASKKKNHPPHEAVNYPTHHTISKQESSNIVQNITYNIQDSVITGDLDSSVSQNKQDSET
jgi:hypothetical protein